MTDISQAKSADKDVSISVEGHTVRVTFESIALTIIVVVVVFGCFVGFVSNGLAARVAQLKDSIMDFLGVLATTIGLSFTRGHMDRRVDAEEGK